MRTALILEYEGSRFCGWQSQPSGGSVQDAVEAALSKIACSPIRVVAAGRTDTGVHASYQVVHFDTQVQRPMTAWVRGTNALLSDDIAVLWASQMPDEFHARYSAQERCYHYFLLNSPVRPALYHARAGWFHQMLNLELMQAAAGMLVGEHDFSAFRAAECQARSPVRTLTKLDVARTGDMVVFELRANAFLHHMVRNIVGCLVYVGKRKYPPEWIEEVLKSGQRGNAAPTFSPAGLYLTGVAYAPAWNLPSFAGPVLPGMLPRPFSR